MLHLLVERERYSQLLVSEFTFESLKIFRPKAVNNLGDDGENCWGKKE